MSTQGPPQPWHYPYQPPVQPQPRGGEGLSIAGFVLGILALLSSWVPILNFFGIFLGVLGAILAGIGVGLSARTRVNGLGIAGLVMSVLAIVLAVVINAVFFQTVDDATHSSVTPPAGSSNQADPSLGSSRANPAPLGSSIRGGDWTVTVDSVEQAAADSIDQKAANGFTLLKVHLTATYRGSDEQGDSPWVGLDFVTADGKSYDSTDGSSLFLAENDFDSLETVYEGGSVSGDRIIEVPSANWRDGVLAVAPDLLSDDTFVSVR